MLNDEICDKCNGCAWFMGRMCDGYEMFCPQYEPVNIDGRSDDYAETSTALQRRAEAQAH